MRSLPVVFAARRSLVPVNKIKVASQYLHWKPRRYKCYCTRQRPNLDEYLLCVYFSYEAVNKEYRRSSATKFPNLIKTKELKQTPDGLVPQRASIDLADYPRHFRLPVRQCTCKCMLIGKPRSARLFADLSAKYQLLSILNQKQTLHCFDR